MVQNVFEALNVDVIKVTIKDKPGPQRLVNEESLKKGFETLRQYAQQEKRIRELRASIAERTSRRRLQYCFETWVKRAMTMRKISEYTKIESSMSNDKKIEMLVSVIAEKQKEIATSGEKSKFQGRAVMAKSAPPNANDKTQANKQSKRALSGGVKFNDAFAQKRLETQRIIIQEQKTKLAEQRKFIEDLKLKELEKEAKRTAKQTIDVAKQALNQCDQRTRRSLIYLMREQGCRDKSITEIPQMPNPPSFLIRMEARAEARRQRMRQADEIRQHKQEEERNKQEIMRRKAEEEERQQQIQAMKEVKRLRKERELRRQKEIQKNNRLEYLANQFYKRYLFRRYILEPLNWLVEERYKRLERANEHYGETLLMKIFSAWKQEWFDQQKIKLELASKLYRHNLLWYAFAEWKIIGLEMKQKYQVAMDFYDMKLQGKYLKAWHTLNLEMKAMARKKEMKAVKYYERRLRIIYFNIWRQYMLISCDIKEREQRRDEWRDLIKKFIPDNLQSNKQLES